MNPAAPPTPDQAGKGVHHVGTEPVQRFVAAFAAAEPELGRGPGAWLLPVRRAAMEQFRARGFPTRKQEDWRYTNLTALLDTSFVESPGATAASPLDSAAAASTVPTSLTGTALRFVFVDGHFDPTRSSRGSLPDGLSVRPLSGAFDAPGLVQRLGRVPVSQEHAFGALNTALFREGAFVHVAAGVCLEEPVELVFVERDGQVPQVRHLRHLVVCEAGSRLDLIEQYGSPEAAGPGRRAHRGVDRSGADRSGAGPSGGSLHNSVIEVFVEEGAVLRHARLRLGLDAGFHVSSVRVMVQEEARYENHFVATGGALVRNDIDARLVGPRADATLNGLFLVDGERQVDTSTVIHHVAAHATSHELYKGVLAERGRGVFRGKIHVHPDAQKTDAKQSSANLLLSDEAVVTSMPNLEIYADDVRCTHGATVGQLDDDALFYLRARGLTRAEARRLLALGFVNDVLDRLPGDALRAALEAHVAASLEGKL